MYLYLCGVFMMHRNYTKQLLFLFITLLPISIVSVHGDGARPPLNRSNSRGGRGSGPNINQSLDRSSSRGSQSAGSSPTSSARRLQAGSNDSIRLNTRSSSGNQKNDEEETDEDPRKPLERINSQRKSTTLAVASRKLVEEGSSEQKKESEEVDQTNICSANVTAKRKSASRPTTVVDNSPEAQQAREYVANKYVINCCGLL